MVLPSINIQDIVRKTSRAGFVRGNDPIFDFNTGEFLTNEGGLLVLDNGRRAIQAWVRKALITERGFYQIYGFDFGSDIHSVIGFDSLYVSARIGNLIKEALRIDSRIESITITDMNLVDNALKVEIHILTEIGEAINEAITIEG